jgi:branched-chain amino acid transport system permease protein
VEILQLAIFGGLTIGVVYALAGASMVVVYRTSGYVSFAQGDIAAVALFVALWTSDQGASYPVVALVTVGVGAVLGGLIGGLIVVPIERFGAIHAVLATIAVGLIIQGIANVVVGAQPRAFPSPGENTIATVGAVNITQADIISLTASAAIFIGLGILFTRTRIGVAMRAISDSSEAANVMGIRSGQLRRLSWVIGGALAGVAGLFVAPTFALTPYSVNAFLIFAFCAIVLGGFESVIGALVAGIAVGIVSNLVATYLDPNLVSISVYALLLVVLLVRPHGIFGRRPIERV